MTRTGSLGLDALRPIDWLLLGVGMLVTAFLTLGTHDLIISYLGAPYPYDAPVPTLVKFIGQIVRFAATVYFCRRAAWFLDRRSALVAALLIGALVAMLNETIRVLIVNWAIYGGSHGMNWVYVLTGQLPVGILTFFQGFVCALIARALPRGWDWRTCAAILVASAVAHFALLPGTHAAAAAIMHGLHLSDPPELFVPPYHWNIYKFIYSTAMEPATAAIIMAALVWPAIDGGPARRIGWFIAVMLLLRGRVVATCLYIFWLDLPLPSAIAAEGDFFLETLVMALAAGVTWQWLGKRARHTSI